MDVAGNAAKALEIMDRDGWGQGNFMVLDAEDHLVCCFPPAQRCVGLAWNLAHHGDTEWQEPTAQARQYLEPLAAKITEMHPDWQVPEGYMDDDPGALKMVITGWNNDPGTTGDMARAVLEELARQ